MYAARALVREMNLPGGVDCPVLPLTEQGLRHADDTEVPT